MIEVKTTDGWKPYCDENIATDLMDMNGVELFTGDVVEVLRVWNFEDGTVQADVVDTAMVIFDQHKRFINTDKFFVEGWLNHNWDDDGVEQTSYTYSISENGTSYYTVCSVNTTIISE
jgi:hypothetical protein